MDKINLNIIRTISKLFIPSTELQQSFQNTLIREQEMFDAKEQKTNVEDQHLTVEQSYPTPQIEAKIDLPILLMPTRPHAKLPEYKSHGAAAMDIYSAETAFILPGGIGIINTGIKLAVPTGWKAEIYNRSGMAASGIIIPNGPGKIDSDYRGEIRVILYNSTSNTINIEIGDRIAQMELNKVNPINLIPTKLLSVTDRGEGGLGHTGK
jgi:dUTP pyrophosphatase